MFNHKSSLNSLHYSQSLSQPLNTPPIHEIMNFTIFSFAIFQPFYLIPVSSFFLPFSVHVGGIKHGMKRIYDPFFVICMHLVLAYILSHTNPLSRKFFDTSNLNSFFCIQSIFHSASYNNKKISHLLKNNSTCSSIFFSLLILSDMLTKQQ